MHWFHAIYSLAAVFMLIGFLWQIASILISIIFLLFNDKVQRILIVIAMGIPYYLMSSYAVLVGIGVGNGEKEISTLIVGGLYLLFTGVMGIGQAQSNAEKENDYVAYKFASYRYIILLASVGFYVYAIFNTNLTINWLTRSLFNLMQWIQDLPVIGLLIGISAFIYAIYMVFSVFIMLFAMIGMSRKNKYIEQ